jgi:hypothetical protein
MPPKARPIKNEDGKMDKRAPVSPSVTKVNHELLSAIRDIVSSELGSLKSDITDALSSLKSLQSTVSSLKTTVEGIESGLNDCSTKVEKTQTVFLPNLNDKINEISTALAMHMIDIDNHSRKWSLIVSGLKGEAHEPQIITRQSCLTLAKDSLGIDDALNTSLAACHRLKQELNAPIIIRFTDLDVRDNWLRRAKNLRNHPDKVSISPDVAPAIRPLKNDILDQRRKLSDEQRRHSQVKYLKQWPYFELHVNGKRHSAPNISKADVIKAYTKAPLQMSFDFN